MTAITYFVPEARLVRGQLARRAEERMRQPPAAAQADHVPSDCCRLRNTCSDALLPAMPAPGLPVSQPRNAAAIAVWRVTETARTWDGGDGSVGTCRARLHAEVAPDSGSTHRRAADTFPALPKSSMRSDDKSPVYRIESATHKFASPPLVSSFEASSTFGPSRMPIWASHCVEGEIGPSAASAYASALTVPVAERRTSGSRLALSLPGP